MKFVIFSSNKWQPNFNNIFTVACIWTKKTQNRASYKFILEVFSKNFIFACIWTKWAQSSAFCKFFRKFSHFIFCKTV